MQKVQSTYAPTLTKFNLTVQLNESGCIFTTKGSLKLESDDSMRDKVHPYPIKPYF